MKNKENIAQHVSLPLYDCYLSDKGEWTYVEKSLKADTLNGRVNEVKYQDKAELSLLEVIENKNKKEFENIIRFTVLEIAKYLKSLQK